MRQERFPPKAFTGIVLAVFIGVALYFRVCLPYDNVFTGDWIKFTSNDAYYHMRLVDNLLRHFPQYITFDPYSFYPNGHTLAWPFFFDWLLAGIILLIGLGSPTDHMVDVVGVYFPAVLGALTVIPVYFIGKELFNRWVGILSAGLIALLPGEFLYRSMLSFTDHHVAETLLVTIVILFLILAIKPARQTNLTLDCVKRRDWIAIRKPLVYSLFAGIFIGIYLLTWVGGLLFVFVIFLYFIVQFIIDHFRGENTDYLAIVGTLSMLTTLVVSLTLLPQTLPLRPLYLPSLIIATVTPLLLTSISRLLTSRGIKPAYYPLSLFGLCLAGLAIIYIIDPVILQSMLGRFHIFFPTGHALTNQETHSLVFQQGSFTFFVAWANFTTGFFLSLISLGILICLTAKQGSPDKTLLVVWSLFMLALTLGQRRFAYYFAINVALLTGYLSWRILEFARNTRIIANPVKTREMTMGKKAKRRKMPKTGRIISGQVRVAVGMLVVFILVFFPNIGPAISIAKYKHIGPEDAWCEALSWLKEETSDPFGKPDFYYDYYKLLPLGEGYEYPETAYGVLAWWDRGHWITRIAHRIPVTNPFLQGASSAAGFFSTQGESWAAKIIERLGVRYVIVDENVAINDFRSVVIRAGKNPEEFFDFYYLQKEDKLVSVKLFYPKYYQSFCIRLYSFDGEAVIPEHCFVISYEEKVDRDGEPYKEITRLRSFPTFEEATDYISRQTSGNYEIVGNDPFVSCVPLDELEHYKLVYQSEVSAEPLDLEMSKAVKIFEYRSETGDA
ncbi:oligosaccharyl transferase, archaeosortase A system-associated [Chloroflexota bacterium]